MVSAIAVRTQTAPGKSRQIFKKVDVKPVAVEVNRRTIALYGHRDVSKARKICL